MKLLQFSQFGLSAAALLGISQGTVLAQPEILTQPQHLTIAGGKTATLSVEATGTPPLSCQWRADASFIAFTNIPGATNVELWTMFGVDHWSGFTPEFALRVLDWLSRPKPD